MTASTCPECGHEHAGPEWAGICIGCPCERRPEVSLAARLLDAVCAAEQHEAAVLDCVMLLRHTGHSELADRLAGTWAAFARHDDG